MADFQYPTSAELQLIARDKIPRLTAQRAIFDFMPMQDADAPLVMWEQGDNFTGLQAVRGLNGEPPKVQKVGMKRWAMQPGIYGEYVPIDEEELTVRRQYGTFGQPVNITDLVMEAQDQLLGRRLDRIESIGWTLVSTGTFSVPGPNGAVLHTDTFNVTTFTAAVTWLTYATATPLNDFRAVQLLSRGHSVNFGAGAVAYMNRVTFNRLANNSNNADLYGRRTQGFGTVNSPAQVNQLLAGDDLPTIQVYDEGYLVDGTGAFTPFIPDATVIVVGKRPAGQPVAAYKMVRNVNNPNMAPGAYMRVVDTINDDPPRSIRVHDGHNGGPAIFFPSAIVRMNV